MTTTEYIPAGCTPIMLITQALSHFNYRLSSRSTIHCTVFIIYIMLYIMCFICLFDVTGTEHTNALTVIYLLFYLFFTRRICPDSNMYKALF